jgi:hypothetical protein
VAADTGFIVQNVYLSRFSKGRAIVLRGGINWAADATVPQRENHFGACNWQTSKEMQHNLELSCQPTGRESEFWHAPYKVTEA